MQVVVSHVCAEEAQCYSLIMLRPLFLRSLLDLRLLLLRVALQVVIMPGGGGGKRRRRSSYCGTPGCLVALQEMAAAPASNSGSQTALMTGLILREAGEKSRASRSSLLM